MQSLLTTALQSPKAEHSLELKMLVAAGWRCCLGCWDPAKACALGRRDPDGTAKPPVPTAATLLRDTVPAAGCCVRVCTATADGTVCLPPIASDTRLVLLSVGITPCTFCWAVLVDLGRCMGSVDLLRPWGCRSAAVAGPIAAEGDSSTSVPAGVCAGRFV